MKGGVLEVLLVDAEGLRRASLFGTFFSLISTYENASPAWVGFYSASKSHHFFQTFPFKSTTTQIPSSQPPALRRRSDPSPEAPPNVIHRILRSSGNAGYYVVVQCGKVTYKSSIKAGKSHRGSWNEKFSFKFPFPDWKNSSHLNMRIMATHMFTEDNFLGETIIHLGGVLEEGGQNGWLELKPALYNIVAEDGKYHGTIKIGLKYIDNVEVEEVVVDQIKDRAEPEKQLPRAIYKTIFNFMRSSWLRFYFHLKHADK